MSLNNICKAFEAFDSRRADYLGTLFINIFHKLPNCFYLYLDDNKKFQYKAKYKNHKVCENKIRIDTKAIIEKALEYSKIDENVKVFCYSSYEWIILGDYNQTNFLMNVTLSDSSEYEGDCYEELFIDSYNLREDIFDLIKDWFIPKEKSDTIDFGIAAMDAVGGIYTSWYDYKLKEIDIDKNYNDDLPYKKICELIESEGEPELMLFYGEPGTGKTSIIKHLIGKYPEKEFVFIDGGLLVNASKEKLMGYFLDNKDTIFVLEDCEKSLVSRENEYNPVMPILLNITDGIIGETLGIKIICTFNTALHKIDKALLRKGRLSLKYEFKPLAKEKVRKILNDNTIDKDMTLADLYNIEDENDFSKKKTSKIGF